MAETFVARTSNRTAYALLPLSIFRSLAFKVMRNNAREQLAGKEISASVLSGDTTRKRAPEPSARQPAGPRFKAGVSRSLGLSLALVCIGSRRSNATQRSTRDSCCSLRSLFFDKPSKRPSKRKTMVRCEALSNRPCSTCFLSVDWPRSSHFCRLLKRSQRTHTPLAGYDFRTSSRSRLP